MVELTWQGKGSKLEPECPAVKVYENSNGQLWQGDNLDLMQRLPNSSISLIYIDPPFNTGRKDLPYKDKWTLDDYLTMMYERLKLMHSLLADDGSIYVHCDWHAGHYLKVMLDDVFGYNNFVNEIAWCYETGGRATNYFPKKHDTIFWYSKSSKYNFFYDQVALTRDFSTMHEVVLTDEDGRQYQRNIKNGKEYRYYLDKGVLPNDWWIDIQALNPSAKERLGYPTQKPLALLDRIIKASSNEGDIVLDPFCGCGTTPAVAEKLGRRWIACDMGQIAIETTIKRLDKIKMEAI